MTFDQTMNDNREFRIFSLALLTLTKSAQVLLQGGADPVAINHINRGLEMIARQLNQAAERLETDLQAGRDIDDLCKNLGVERPDDPAP
jgi:hypothetical protein